MRVRDLYKDVLLEIMAENEIEPLPLETPPTPIVPPNAEFREVVQSTYFYLHTRDYPRYDHYRYRRYIEMLRLLRPTEGSNAIVDVGCGAGTFSWAFLDWAREVGIEYDSIVMYGLDHSQAMLKLAQITRDKLASSIVDYPAVLYSTDVDTLLVQMTENNHENMDYILTFGHVLAQSNTPHDIQSYTRIIMHILHQMDRSRNCVLVGVDARGASANFLEAWNALIENLTDSNLNVQQRDANQTPINDGLRAKYAQIKCE